MKFLYSVPVISQLIGQFHRQDILRPFRRRRYDPGSRIRYEVRSVFPDRKIHVELEIEKFIGGGFAGQVYKAKLIDAFPQSNDLTDFVKGRSYALKIFIPPTGFSRWFRNVMYFLAFQGPFSLQVNPSAVRSAALWQKLIRRGAGIVLGDENFIVDVLGTFIDKNMGSCGEISEWINGRLWRLEADDNLDARKQQVTEDHSGYSGSPEYRTKKDYMARLVKLMHDMGAVELARQYEWWTCKSQPNALKRTASDPDPRKGFVAVDFRAGLALLPFLPMCPVDFKLILKGIARGSLVQFDRGNMKRLKTFVQKNGNEFASMKGLVEELEQTDRAYRDSLPDIFHHHFRLLFSSKLRFSIRKAFVQSWVIRKNLDENKAGRIARNRLCFFFYYILGAVPFMGGFFRRIWGRPEFRRHIGRAFSSPKYLFRTGRARILESLIRWHRAGRISGRLALKLSRHPAFAFPHYPLSVLPAGMHRFFSDGQYARQILDNIFARPLRLYFKPREREKWLLAMISQGENSGMLNPNEAGRIRAQVKEPFIQKYLKSLAVHVCTVPVTQIVSVIVALVYVRLHPELSWQEASLHAGIILGLFQVTPISPGSLVRGLYVSFLVLKEKNFKDYNIAFYLSFFKYIGYLAFPIQMAYRYPDLARFMAGHWATGAVHIVPVFGERGALLEHAVFDLFYNYPLTVRRRLRLRKKKREGIKPRARHIPLCILGGTILLALIDIVYFQFNGIFPGFGKIWWAVLWIPALVSAAVTRWAGGMRLARRLAAGVFSGALLGVLSAALHVLWPYIWGQAQAASFFSAETWGRAGTDALWRAFLFTLIAIAAAFKDEIRPLS